MEKEAGSLYDAAVRAIIEGINRAKSLRQEYLITLRCSRCGVEATRMNAATQDTLVRIEEDASIPEYPIDVTIYGPEQELYLTIDAIDREYPMGKIDEIFLAGTGLEIYIKKVEGPQDLEELGREFRADQGLNTEETCPDCEKWEEFKTNAEE